MAGMCYLSEERFSPLTTAKLVGNGWTNVESAGNFPVSVPDSQLELPMQIRLKERHIWTFDSYKPDVEHKHPYSFLPEKIKEKGIMDDDTLEILQVNIGGIRFSDLKCYNTSWHRYIRLLGSVTLQSETAVEGFMAEAQAPQTSSEEGE
ncbi:unnamed protein product [Porites evermanni]|uniref:Uncharacterized protein n=1 Tax=Porites evermanni TaxID=104178 RepID=A0ABN8QJZ1_9CNID|nr:unnamed protein product [Porites evermanni]